MCILFIEWDFNMHTKLKFFVNTILIVPINLKKRKINEKFLMNHFIYSCFILPNELTPFSYLVVSIQDKVIASLLNSPHLTIFWLILEWFFCMHLYFLLVSLLINWTWEIIRLNIQYKAKIGWKMIIERLWSLSFHKWG